jgi:hypothetical protein
MTVSYKASDVGSPVLTATILMESLYIKKTMSGPF